MKICGLVLLVAAVHAARLPTLRQQVAGPNSPMVLNNTDASLVPNTVSEVNVDCSGGEATLTLTRVGRAGEAQIQVGSEGVSGCDVPRSNVAAGGSLPITVGAECGRVGTPVSYRWEVTVTEWFNSADPLKPFGPYSAQFSVVCANTPVDPTETPVATEPPAVSEGSAQFTGSVSFVLESAASNNARVWVLQLRPAVVADLRGQSYRIDDLIASAPGGNSATLIQNGCITDVDGVRVEQGTAEDQVTTIRITAFQFTSAPGAEISFSATVALCTPAAPGGICAPVLSAAACAVAPATEPTDAPTVETTVEETEAPTDAPEETTVAVVVEETTEEVVIPPVDETRARKVQAKVARIPETRRPRRGLAESALGRLTVKTI